LLYESLQYGSTLKEKTKPNVRVVPPGILKCCEQSNKTDVRQIQNHCNTEGASIIENKKIRTMMTITPFITFNSSLVPLSTV